MEQEFKYALVTTAVIFAILIGFGLIVITH